MKHKLLLALVLSGLFLPVCAEKIHLDIYARRFDSIPIAIVDFTSRGGTELRHNQPWRIVANDYDLSGRFVVTTAPKFDSARFMEAGAGIYIDGSYARESNDVAVTFEVRETSTKELLVRKEYRGTAAALRSIAHRFSNELYDLLSGQRGIFESRILYVKVSGGTKNIAIMDFDGGNSRLITRGSVFNLFPAFMDSTTMLWTSYQRGKPDIYKGSLRDATRSVFVASRGIQVSPAVNPIDGTVAYASSRGGTLEIYVSDDDGKRARRLTTGGGVKTAPCWSPNGYQIAFTSDKSGRPQIYLMDSEGGNQRRITFKSPYCDSPVWSPRGDLIAFASMADNGKLDIWTITPDGTEEKRITDIPGNCEYPTFSPDGSMIAFVCRHGDRSDLYFTRPDGSRVRRVTRSGDVLMPDWGR